MHELIDAAIELLIYFTGVAVIACGLIVILVSALRRIVGAVRSLLK